MQRSKTQALMFLLGATLVGGVLGFSFERYGRSVTTKDHFDRSMNWRQFLYRDLGLTEDQRCQWDAIIDSNEVWRNNMMAPYRPQLDSLRKAEQAIRARVKPQEDSLRQLVQSRVMTVLTPDQRTKYEARRADMRRNDSLQRAQRRAADSVRRAEPSKCPQN
jgi:hypothetical protein